MLKGAQAAGQTQDLLVFRFFLSTLKQRLRPLGYCSPQTPAGFYDEKLTDDSDGEGALPRVAGQVRCPDLDQRGPDLELGGRRERRNADHAWAVAGVVCGQHDDLMIYRV